MFKKKAIQAFINELEYKSKWMNIKEASVELGVSTNALYVSRDTYSDVSIISKRINGKIHYDVGFVRAYSQARLMLTTKAVDILYELEETMNHAQMGRELVANGSQGTIQSWNVYLSTDIFNRQDEKSPLSFALQTKA